MKTLLHVYFLGIVLMASLAHGDPLATYVFNGTANGSVGGQTFTDMTLSVTGPADTKNIVNGGPFKFNEIDFNPGAAILSIGGVGSGTFSNLVFVVDNYGNGVLLLGGLFGLATSDIINLTDADLGSNVFSTYFLNTSIGPIGPAPDEAVAAWRNIPTSLGNVTVTSYTDVTFQATVVPEPSSNALLIGGLLLIAVMFRTKIVRPPHSCLSTTVGVGKFEEVGAPAQAHATHIPLNAGLRNR